MSTERFWEKVDVRGPGECWGWRAGRDGQGYGAFKWDGRLQGAHRVAYQMMVGPIPVGLTLDHLCRNRACVNPAHLEPVTSGENVLRGVSNSAHNARKTHCPHGHPYAGNNLYVSPTGGRKCKHCMVEGAHRRYLARRQRKRRVA